MSDVSLINDPDYIDREAQNIMNKCYRSGREHGMILGFGLGFLASAVFGLIVRMITR